MKISVATSIKTNIWNHIINDLKKENWTVVSEYSLFDKGIDFDFYELSKEGVCIRFCWDNWSEGEIEATEETFLFLQKKYNRKFKFGEVVHFKSNYMELLQNNLKYN